LVSITDQDRQWFKSHHGLAARETPREVSFCAHVVADDQALVVSDALEDQRFADNPLVTGEPRVRFYAGAPLRDDEGLVLGALCAIDHVPRRISSSDRQCLDDELRALERAHDEEKEKIRITLNALTEAVVTINDDGTIGYLNPAAERMAGWTLEEARGRSIDQVLSLQSFVRAGQARPSIHSELTRLSLQKGTNLGVLSRRDGSECAIEYSAAPLADGAGRSLGTVVVSHDVGEMLALANQMSHLAHHDALTGLPNRLLLQDRTTQAIETARRKKTRFALFFMDLDKFKHINDTVGHATADELLKGIAHRLVRMFRGCDTVCRQGGDEFVLLLQEVTDGQAAAKIADKVLSTMSQPFVIQGQSLLASFSIGATLFPEDGQDFDTLIKQADAAMYRAKLAGGNRYQLFSPRTGTRA
jgi:diguanylate cyclase (GGDEF)-like protein/PAS domain S-box-containing protein